MSPAPQVPESSFIYDSPTKYPSAQKQLSGYSPSPQRRATPVVNNVHDTLLELCQQKPKYQISPNVTYQRVLTYQGACLIIKNYDRYAAHTVTVNIQGSSNVVIEDGDQFMSKTVVLGPRKGDYVIMSVPNPSQKPRLVYDFNVE